MVTFKLENMVEILGKNLKFLQLLLIITLDTYFTLLVKDTRVMDNVIVVITVTS